jgi:hypothetical protein
MAASSSGAAAPVATAFTWEAGAAIAIVVAANLLCYLLNSRSLLWRACACHVSTVLVSNRREGVPPAQAPLTWFAWDLISSKDVVSAATALAALLPAVACCVHVAMCRAQGCPASHAMPTLAHHACVRECVCMQVTSGAIGVQGLTLYRAFEVVVFAFTTAYGVSGGVACSAPG